MEVSAWSNGKNGYGIRVGKANRRAYFDPAWQEIIVEIEDEHYAFALTSGFWHKCPEFRDSGKPVIREWLERQKTLPWPARQPPKFDLTQKDGNRFVLQPTAR